MRGSSAEPMDWAPLSRSVERRRGLSGLAARAELERIRGMARRLDSVGADAALRPRVAAVIVTEPRTASTYLQGLLAVGAVCRTLRYTDGLYPLPDRSGPSVGQREREAERRLRLIQRLSPDLARLRPLGPGSVEECSVPFEYHGVSLNLDLKFGCGEYGDWLWSLPPGGEVMAAAYRWYGALLGDLGEPEVPWVLKAPAHGLAWAALRRRFAGAAIIRIRRPHPARIPSALRLVRAIRSLYAEQAPTESTIAAEWEPKLRTLEQRIDEGTEEARDSVLELSFGELTADPARAIRRVSEFAGLELRPSPDATALSRVRRQSVSMRSPAPELGRIRSTDPTSPLLGKAGPL